MKKIILKLRNNFITGIAVTLPVLVTILVIWFLFTKLNIYLLNPAVNLLEQYLSIYWMEYIAKFVIFVIVFLFISLLGFATKSIITLRLLRGMEKLFTKVPLIGRVYKATRQISSAFLGEGKTMFMKVVLIEYPREKLYSIAFITRETKGEIQHKTEEEVLSAFVPTTPNPTSGVFVLVPKSDAIELDMSVEEGLKLVISGGSVIPDYLPETELDRDNYGFRVKDKNKNQ